MAAIVGRKVNAIGLVIGGDNEAADVEDVILPHVLLIDAQHFRRRCGQHLHLLIEIEAADLAEIASFAHPQHHRFGIAVKSPGDVLG